MRALSIQGKRALLSVRPSQGGETTIWRDQTRSAEVALRWTDETTIKEVVDFFRRYLEKFETWLKNNPHQPALVGRFPKVMGEWLEEDHTYQNPRVTYQFWEKHILRLQRASDSDEGMPYLQVRNWTTPMTPPSTDEESFERSSH